MKTIMFYLLIFIGSVFLLAPILSAFSLSNVEFDPQGSPTVTVPVVSSNYYVLLRMDLESDFEIQNLPISKLKQISKPEKHTYSVQYKITNTGLDANTILLIETNKYRATLHELMMYCKGLHISYNVFLPELFKTENI